jgi:seryl-tRNA synthetase
MWLERGLAIMRSLGLPAKSEVASDPFFGRGGKMLASAQLEQQLKFEVTVPVISEEKPTALCSFNWHQEKFGKIFEIKTADGETANTACLGFGMERVCMALFKHHGFDPKTWPAAVRELLWP